MHWFLPALLLAHAADPRFPDPAIRTAVLGCWDVGSGATLTLAQHGKHSVWATSRFADRPQGGPAKISKMATWVKDDQTFEVSCRPRSQHGSFCRVAPDSAGGLRVRVYARGYRTGASGRLAEDFVAGRCPTK